MKQRKNNLDERQEQTLLQIEHRGCWLAFWGLLASMVVQMVAYGAETRQLAGEWIVFMVLVLYLAFACLKHGIWDRRLKPNAKTNLLLSLAAALVVGLVLFLSVLGKYPDRPAGAATVGILTAACCFALCFAALTVSAASYRKRAKALEQEPESPENDDL